MSKVNKDTKVSLTHARELYGQARIDREWGSEIDLDTLIQAMEDHGDTTMTAAQWYSKVGCWNLKATRSDEVLDFDCEDTLDDDDDTSVVINGTQVGDMTLDQLKEMLNNE